MSKFNILAVILAIFLIGPAAAAQRGGGGGGGGGHGGGGGGGGHFGGGGGHIGGGGGHFGGGGGHFGGGARFGGGGGHFGGARFGGARPGGGGARFGGSHFGGRHIGRPGISHSAAGPGFRGHRSFATHGNAGRASRRATLPQNRNATSSRNGNPTFRGNRNASVRSRAVQHALNSRAVAGALHNRAALRNPNMRARIAASAATAGWQHGRGRNGWWRHRHGGYGWVGPLFWPFAYDDWYGYTMWGYGDDPSFWDYGYNDIYAGIFAPYGYDALAGYLPPSGSGSAPASRAPTAAATSDQLAQMCGEDSREIAGLPIDQIQQAIQPNDAQRAALDDLANASVKAAQDIKAACPTQIGSTAPARLESMQKRIEAMIAAVGTVQPALQKFYDLLNDDQKARLNALGRDQLQDQRQGKAAKNTAGSLAQSCDAAQSGVLTWPAAQIDAKLHPTDDQRASLTALQDATAKAADMLKASCQPSDAITPPARLEAVGKRLNSMLEAVKTVRTALDDFYGKLSDEQKAQFEAIGPRRAPLSDQSGTTRSRGHRRHASVEGMIRHFIWLAR
jgi:hypothetical protein